MTHYRPNVRTQQRRYAFDRAVRKLRQAMDTEPIVSNGDVSATQASKEPRSLDDALSISDAIAAMARDFQ